MKAIDYALPLLYNKGIVIALDYNDFSQVKVRF